MPEIAGGDGEAQPVLGSVQHGAEHVPVDLEVRRSARPKEPIRNDQRTFNGRSGRLGVPLSAR